MVSDVVEAAEGEVVVAEEAVAVTAVGRYPSLEWEIYLAVPAAALPQVVRAAEQVEEVILLPKVPMLLG